MSTSLKQQIFSWQKSLTHYFLTSPDRLRAIKVTIAIGVLTAPFVLLGESFFAITLALGALAGALSETDDHPKGRMKSLALKVICFAISSLSVELLRPYPILLGCGLFASTIAFVLIGSLGERYRGVTFGAQLIGLYTMLTITLSPAWYWQPILLPAGALFYGLFSLYLLYLNPWRALDEHLARGFGALATYLEVKAGLFPSDKNKQGEIRNQLALLNVQVVGALDGCKEVLNSYGDSIDDKTVLQPYMRYFMLLQNLHERAASSHERYDLLSSDQANRVLLEGIGHTLLQYSHASKKFAESLLAGKTYIHPISLGWMVDALNDQLKKHDIAPDQPVAMIVRNLSRSHLSLQNLHEDSQRLLTPKLRKDNRSLMLRAKELLDWQNPRLHHAFRLGLCFLVGFTISEVFAIAKGEWIILTTLFVCQPTYSATRQRLYQRILGTILGVVGGVLIIQILPTIQGQLLLLLVSTYAFSLWQLRNYSVSVMFITIFVLCAFNLLAGKGSSSIMLPRLIDTLIGSALAIISVRLLWPNWQYKRLPALIAEAISKNTSYFQAILEEYLQSTGEDDLPYRIARREAHRADNALVRAWQDMQFEPRNRQQFRQQAFTLTYLNHALLAYISAFGVHRDQHTALSPEIAHLANDIVGELQKTSLSITTGKTLGNTRIINILKQIRHSIRGSSQPIPKQQFTSLYNIADVTEQLLKLANGFTSPRE
ncbi:YccS family putative transporter [Desulfogranum marinum]|uniref:YccS family putative transporter n=1 Tax=Desulfogranum marinum TaxID=453220 RepID=UPI0029C927CA|nr:YccS family putative transporter [Desulfogranum marinum]